MTGKYNNRNLSVLDYWIPGKTFGHFMQKQEYAPMCWKNWQWLGNSIQRNIGWHKMDKLPEKADL